MKEALRIINDTISQMDDESKGKISDGYHTFNELYEHRCLLWIFALKYLKAGLELSGYDQSGDVWRSKKHSDGSEWEGWFLLGCATEQRKQMTYHLPSKYWDMCEFAETYETAPEFDGHTSADVLERIKQLIKP